MAISGNSNVITRKYLDSLLIETRYMNSFVSDQSIELYGAHFDSPVMTAALSHLDHFMFDGATAIYASAAAKTGTLLWLGMADDQEVERCAATGAKMIEIIKPYADRELIYRKIRHAESIGLLAVGIDIDHPFADDGSLDIVDGYEMAPLATEELRDFCRCTSLPLIVKGVLSPNDARRCLEAGVSGIVLSHHGGRVAYSIPPLLALEQIADVVKGRMKIFIDCGIVSGMDAYKCLALGADAVSVGRHLMPLLRDGVDATAKRIKEMTAELAGVMCATGVTELKKMDPTVIHRMAF